MCVCACACEYLCVCVCVCACVRYINKVMVQDMQTHQVCQFLCDCWLSADRGDGTTKKVFNAAKNNEIASFRLETHDRP